MLHRKPKSQRKPTRVNVPLTESDRAIIAAAAKQEGVPEAQIMRKGSMPYASALLEAAARK